MGMTPTIHNSAKYGEIAPVVLMPGDPHRADHIAKHYLSDAKLVSSVRGIPAYTGVYVGRPVSVMASGMGAGSMGIYSHELYFDYGVEKIIRVGTAGGLREDLRLRDIVLALCVSTDSGFASQFELPGTFSPGCSFALARAAAEAAEDRGFRVLAGMLFSGSAFHYENSYLARYAKLGAIAVEMETAALYMNAAAAGKEALTVCTVTDMVFTGEHCSVEERESSLADMIEVALAAAVK